MVTLVLVAIGDSGGDTRARVGVGSPVVAATIGSVGLAWLMPLAGVGAELSPLTAVGVGPPGFESQLASAPADASSTRAISPRACFPNVCLCIMLISIYPYRGCRYS